MPIYFYLNLTFDRIELVNEIHSVEYNWEWVLEWKFPSLAESECDAISSDHVANIPPAR